MKNGRLTGISGAVKRSSRTKKHCYCFGTASGSGFTNLTCESKGCDLGSGEEYNREAVCAPRNKLCYGLGNGHGSKDGSLYISAPKPV